MLSVLTILISKMSQLLYVERGKKREKIKFLVFLFNFKLHEYTKFYSLFFSSLNLMKHWNLWMENSRVIHNCNNTCREIKLGMGFMKLCCAVLFMSCEHFCLWIVLFFVGREAAPWEWLYIFEWNCALFQEMGKIIFRLGIKGFMLVCCA